MVTFHRDHTVRCHHVVNHTEGVWTSVDEVAQKDDPVTFLQVHSIAQFHHRSVESVDIAHRPYVLSCVQSRL